MKRKVVFLFLIPLIIFVAGVILVFVRFQVAVAHVQQQEEQIFNSSVSDLGSTKTLSILPLFENAAAAGLESGHGVSYLIRTDTETILMDLGFNPQQENPSALEKNMRALGVSLDQVTLLFISHTHGDHLGSKNSFGDRTFWFSTQQPLLNGWRIYTPEDMQYPGSQPVWVKAPLKLGQGIASTGPVPYTNTFPANIVLPGGVEQSLVINVQGLGLVLISGCGHPGMQRTVAYAQNIFDQPVVGVFGGQHYTTLDAQALAPEIAFLHELNPVLVALSPHDSGEAALDAFRQAFRENYKEIAVGQEIVVQ